MISKTVRDIKSLKIQGATNIAVAAVLSLRSLTKKTYKTRESFDKDILEAVVALSRARATEPAMRNSLRQVSRLSAGTVKQAQKELTQNIHKFLKTQKKNKLKTAENLASLVEDGDIIFTHCHSSTVTAGLKLAKKQKKRFAVINSETRPLYQGRITAKELEKAKIPLTHITDSASAHFIPQVTKVFVGCDSIEWKGNIINKTGSFALALLSNHFCVPFYSVTESYKFSPETKDAPEEIEYRSPKEVWKEKINILNPAFDRVPAKFVTGIISELGVLKPKDFVKIAKNLYKI